MTNLDIVRSVDAPDPGHGETAAVRLLSLLPQSWRYRCAAGPDRISLSITAPGASSDEVRSVVGVTLAAVPALRRWHLAPPP